MAVVLILSLCRLLQVSPRVRDVLSLLELDRDCNNRWEWFDGWAIFECVGRVGGLVVENVGLLYAIGL